MESGSQNQMETMDWLASYLSGRVQRISVNGGTSDAFHLNQGVPQ